jgi:drug/metabolite transporter (DMT)-like permease
MCLGVSLLPLMNTFAKYLAGEYPLWQVVCARFLGHLVWVSILFVPTVGWALFRPRQPWGQLRRSSVFFLSNLAFISALPFVPLATASAIMFMAPLLVTVLSIPLLGERVGPWRWGAVVLGFIGALIIIRPGSAVFSTGSAMVLVSAACFGVYQVWTRQLSADERPQTQAVFTAVVGAVVATCVLPFVVETPRSWLDVGAFLGIGLVGGLAQFFVIQALQRGPASVISPIGYVELMSAVAFGYAVFGDFPDHATWAGAGLIIVAGIVIALREQRLR